MTPIIPNRAEIINQALFEISQAVNNTSDLNGTYELIHKSLSRVLNVKNFYIALYDEAANKIRFPFYIDEKKNTSSNGVLTNISETYEYSLKLTKGSMTAMVIESGESLIITKTELMAFCQRENCQPSGIPPEIWLGAPLKLKGNIIGVMAVQSYDNPHAFDGNDARVLTSVCDQVAIAIERKSYENSLLESEARYRNLVENSREILYSSDSSGAIVYANSVANSLFGYPHSEIVGKKGWSRFQNSKTPGSQQLKQFADIIHPQDRPQVQSALEKAHRDQTSFQTEYRIITGNNKGRWVLEKGRFISSKNDGPRLEGIILDIHDRKRAELVNRTLYNISDAVNTTFDLEELYRVIHQSLNRVINVKNFYIALYDKATDSVSFPFDIDEKGNDKIAEISNVSQSTSLTGEVIRTGQKVLLTKKEAQRLVNRYGDGFIGDPAELWLGVPLKVRNEVIGAMVTQSYSDPDLYDDKDVETFLSVSDQVATAIDRKRHEEELLRKELQLRTLFEISNAINTTFNMEELYQSIHKSLQRIIDVRNLGIALYDKNTDIIEYPYLVDEKFSGGQYTIKNASQSCSLAYEVINAGKPMVMGRKQIDEFIQHKGGERIGQPSKSWLGLPLQGKTRILGAIVVQNYEESDRFKKKEIDLLMSVSGQIAFAIERKQAEADLAATQRELIEYAHKVGMADIANDTLHNIGNILNSVKISTEQIHVTVRDSDFPNFQKANQLLKEKVTVLKTDREESETLLKLMDYYERLEQQFDKERDIIQEQISRLNQKIGLMTDVITTQQNFTSASFMTGEYSLEDILEDVLTMQADMLHNHRITIKKDFEKVPPIKVQRTKLVHILINLLINARDAMVETPSEERVLGIFLSRVQDKVQLEISDTGIGISNEDFTRIFTHGFTTKENGHGFGLHNSAIYLEEMKGQIWAESDGPGQGSVFKITLPVKSNSKRPAHDQTAI